MTHRFFIPPEWIDPSTIHLRDDTARQIKTVLRMQPDNEIVVLDNSGFEWRAVITTIAKGLVTAQILDKQPAQGEPSLRLILYQGTLKGQKFEWVLQKGTELGVFGFVPTICQRSIVRDPRAIEKKYARWQQIIKEAAEQSGRGKLPQLASPLPFNEALSQAQSQALTLLPWEKAEGSSLTQCLNENQVDTIALFIGSEGGYTDEEAQLAQQTGAKLLKLGQRILRAETAAIAVCAAIMNETGEWA